MLQSTPGGNTGTPTRMPVTKADYHHKVPCFCLTLYRFAQYLLGFFAADVFVSEVNKHQVIICAT